MKPSQKSVVFANGSNSNNDNSRLMEKLEALTVKMDSQFQVLKEEMHEMRRSYNNRGGDHASKNDDTLMKMPHGFGSRVTWGGRVRDMVLFRCTEGVQEVLYGGDRSWREKRLGTVGAVRTLGLWQKWSLEFRGVVI
uniref:Reverse transcriptase domain-containing protein n=1 Tax=Tanacetum cinerariifolium TaxID=118510 RepID=A0A699I1R2_TANCI|nr:reverse transcriptase domain-containing protein [Tanacetum cinerariifolium]